MLDLRDIEAAELEADTFPSVDRFVLKCRVVHLQFPRAAEARNA